MSGTAATPPTIGSPEWSGLVTASKVPTILSISPWESPLSLWWRMRGDLPATAETTTTRRGHYLEPAILAWWHDQHPDAWDVRIDEWVSAVPWGGATLDALALMNDGSQVIVEAKSAARRDEWGRPGTDEIPAYYLAQVQWQLAMCPDATRAHVAVLFGPGLEFVEYVVERDEPTEAALLRICEEFYRSLASDVAPPLDDHVATYEALRRIHPDIDGMDVEVPATAARRYVRAQAAAKAAETRARREKSALLARMGTARTASHKGTTIARRQPGRGDAVNLITTTTTL